MGATDGVGKAFAVDLLDPDMKATGIGYLGTMTGIATLIASTMAGILWDHFGAGATFVYGVAGATVTAVTLSFLKTSKPIVIH